MQNLKFESFTYCQCCHNSFDGLVTLAILDNGGLYGFSCPAGSSLRSDFLIFRPENGTGIVIGLRTHRYSVLVWITRLISGNLPATLSI